MFQYIRKELQMALLGTYRGTGRFDSRGEAPKCTAKYLSGVQI